MKFKIPLFVSDEDFNKAITCCERARDKDLLGRLYAIIFLLVMQVVLMISTVFILIHAIVAAVDLNIKYLALFCGIYIVQEIVLVYARRDLVKSAFVHVKDL